MRLSLIVVINVSTDNLIMRVVKFIPLSFAFPSLLILLSLSLFLRAECAFLGQLMGSTCTFWDLRSAIGESVRLIFMESKGDKFFPLIWFPLDWYFFFFQLLEIGRLKWKNRYLWAGSSYNDNFEFVRLELISKQILFSVCLSILWSPGFLSLSKVYGLLTSFLWI